MPTYVVRKGDCLASIASAHGFHRWQTIYDAPENEAFRKKRPNPNVIHPGDRLFIPEKQTREEERAASKSHQFRLHRSKWLLRLELRDESLKGLEGVPYTLDVAGAPTITGKTGVNGLVEAAVPASAQSATLRLAGRTIALRLAGLDPVRRVSGVQQRLNNLGFNAGAADGKLGPRTRRALSAFQAAESLDRTGAMDDETLRRLLEVHDNDVRLSDPEEEPAAEEAAEQPDAGEAPGPGGWTGEDMVCHPPDIEQIVTPPQDLFFAIYYIEPDGTRSFERAAETWRSQLGQRPGFTGDQYLGIGVLTEEEFVDGWLQVEAEARRRHAAVREGHIFTHGSLRGNETGLEFDRSADGLTLTRPEIDALPRLPWRSDGLLVLHSCNSGVDRDGWNPTAAFGRRQGVRALGQTGSAFFSQEDSTWVEIRPGAPDVFLRAYYHGRNRVRHPIEQVVSSQDAMPDFEFTP